MYLAVFSRRDCDIIMFYERGGIDVGDIDAKVVRIIFFAFFFVLKFSLCFSLFYFHFYTLP